MIARLRFVLLVTLGAASSLAACAPSDSLPADGTTSSASGAGAAGATSSSTGFESGASSGAGGSACQAPDMLISLDRTLTMHFMPNGATPTDAPAYASSKWSEAITAIRSLVQPPLDSTIRFGLELWPKQEPGCITLTERIEDTVQATNPSCEDGEVLLSPQLGASSEVASDLDPLSTKICLSTPTGSALLTAATHLSGIKQAGRDQFILLVTDGADWDQSCPTPDPVTTVQDLAGQGIKTFVLGFSASGDLMPNGVGAPFLNDMACAGMTAPDFDNNCTMGTTGYVAVDPAGPTLYYQASDQAALSQALDAVAGLVCCDCPQ